jgi:hypothetical protein
LISYGYYKGVAPTSFADRHGRQDAMEIDVQDMDGTEIQAAAHEISTFDMSEYELSFFHVFSST